MVQPIALAERDSLATEFVAHQTNLYNRQFFGDSVDTVTPLAELEEEFEKVKKGVLTTQKQLEECCEELNEKIQKKNCYLNLKMKAVSPGYC